MFRRSKTADHLDRQADAAEQTARDNSRISTDEDRAPAERQRAERIARVGWASAREYRAKADNARRNP